ncbi:11207_t:CDS:2 [Entrophospora sp. SA101]|nr:11207_t:CDS:2 [Entrophospora sp. SA101]
MEIFKEVNESKKNDYRGKEVITPIFDYAVPFQYKMLINQKVTIHTFGNISSPLKLTNYAMDPLDWSIANLGKKLKNQLAGLALQPKLVIDEPCRCIREAEFGVWNKKSFLTAFANKADNYQYIIGNNTHT